MRCRRETEIKFTWSGKKCKCSMYFKSIDATESWIIIRHFNGFDSHDEQTYYLKYQWLYYLFKIENKKKKKKWEGVATCDSSFAYRVVYLWQQSWRNGQCKICFVSPIVLFVSIRVYRMLTKRAISQSPRDILKRSIY